MKSLSGFWFTLFLACSTEYLNAANPLALDNLTKLPLNKNFILSVTRPASEWQNLLKLKDDADRTVEAGLRKLIMGLFPRSKFSNTEKIFSETAVVIKNSNTGDDQETTYTLAIQYLSKQNFLDSEIQYLFEGAKAFQISPVASGFQSKILTKIKEKLPQFKETVPDLDGSYLRPLEFKIYEQTEGQWISPAVFFISGTDSSNAIDVLRFKLGLLLSGLDTPHGAGVGLLDTADTRGEAYRFQKNNILFMTLTFPVSRLNDLGILSIENSRILLLDTYYGEGLLLAPPFSCRDILENILD